MRHNQSQNPRRKASPALWGILLLAALGMSFGGTKAYLSYSAGPVPNRFTADVHPTISVSDDYKVTVSNTAYGVYLRAAVVVNWKSTDGNSILAAMPKEGTDYTVDGAWEKLDENFYYYNQVVTNGTIDAPIVTLSGTKSGYTLVANIAVQAVQAVGQTDEDDPQDAVFNAWNIQAAQIKAH